MKEVEFQKGLINISQRKTIKKLEKNQKEAKGRVNDFQSRLPQFWTLVNFHYLQDSC